MLEICLLGERRFLLDGKDISNSVSAKCAAMIAILITQDNHRVSREKLMGLLWPESSEEAAKYNLRYNFWQLKKVLQNTNEELLLTSKNYCEINSNYPWHCDYLDVLSTDIEADSAEIEKCLAYLNGDLLQGMFFEDCEELSEFVMVQRCALEQKKVRMLKTLSRRYQMDERWEDCLRVLEENEKTDPYDEDDAVKRIQILLQEGRRREAESFYRRFCTRLFRDIGSEPGTALRQVGQGLRSNKEDTIQRYYIRIHGIRNINFYAIASLLDAFLQLEQFDFLQYMESTERMELAYIQRKLGPIPARIPSDARLADCVLNCMDRVAQSGKNILVECSMESLDAPSRGILTEIQRRCENEKCAMRVVISR